MLSMYSDIYSEIVVSFPPSSYNIFMIAGFLVTVGSINDIAWNFLHCLCIDKCYMKVLLEEKVKTLAWYCN